MDVRLAQSDAEIAACHPVMRELRPHLDAAEFMARVRAQERDGYRLAYLTAGGRVVAVAGFRVSESLAWGRFLYVDDLVTLAEARSKGYGAALLAWLNAHARAQDCRELHLDSGTWRTDAHRFYAREGMDMIAHHYRSVLDK
jgi:GNAT superfamily N-acetyltransferase